jgi:hypothetical protein
MNDITPLAPGAPARAVAERSAIPGWGVDADSANDPTYPYRIRTAEDHSGNWPQPVLQQVDVEVLQSIEHKRRPAVVGTSTPPSGVSGMIRRAAFRWSESNLVHWMLLLGADRVNVVEGIVSDLSHARLPNIPREMGIRAELRYNKAGLAKKAAIGLGILGTIALLRRSRRPRA